MNGKPTGLTFDVEQVGEWEDVGSARKQHQGHASEEQPHIHLLLGQRRHLQIRQLGCTGKELVTP